MVLTLKKKNLVKAISGLTVGIVALTALLVFVCPFGGMRQMQTRTNASALCQSSANASAGDMGRGADCFQIHLSVANRFMGVLPQAMSALLVIIIALLIALYFYKVSFLSDRTRAIFSRFKHYFSLYSTNIKIRFEKKLRAWLVLIGGNAIAFVA